MVRLVRWSVGFWFAVAACGGARLDNPGGGELVYRDAAGAPCVPRRAEAPPQAGTEYGGCLTIEGDRLGVEVSGELDGVSFALTDWVAEHEARGYVELALTTSGELVYAAEAGGGVSVARTENRATSTVIRSAPHALSRVALCPAMRTPGEAVGLDPEGTIEDMPSAAPFLTPPSSTSSGDATLQPGARDEASSCDEQGCCATES